MDRPADSCGMHSNGTITQAELDVSLIEHIQQASPGPGRKRKHEKKIKDLWCAFDIETSRLPGDQSVMYIWQMQIGEETVIGRTWEEFLQLIKRLSEAAKKSDQVILIYVHNLSYEFQFLSGILEPENVFAVRPRKVLKFDWRNLQFRCSYLLTNLSLEAFTKQFGVESAKLSGFDYEKIRYPWTPLTEDELAYCINDVKGLAQALQAKAELNGDTLATMPLTATGYIRREARRAMRGYHWKQLHDQMPSWKVYKLSRAAFRGGDTHASRFYAGKVIEQVQSWDRSSSYPEVMINHMFPGSKFWFIKDENATAEKILSLIRHGRALLMRLCLKNVSLIDPFEGCPYIPRSKCRPCVAPWEDNGRILSADYLEIAVTDIDLMIILEQYKYEEIAFYDVAYARYRPLPFPLRNLILKYYKEKTELKGVENMKTYYDRVKELINSCYGMSAQDPGKPSILYSQERGFVLGDEITPEEFQKKMYNAFLSYCWAPWVTAWARLELHEARKMCGRRFVYCDTDSVKFDADPDKPWPMPDFSEYNENKEKLADESGAFADDAQGTRHYMGVYEYEGTSRFKTLGAKKYVSEQDGIIKLTCAGVGKRSGSAQLMAKREGKGGLDLFEIGYTFAGEAGGLEAVYNDDADEIREVEGHKLHITKNVCLRPSTYTLGITADYALAIRHANDIMRRIKDE